MLTTIFRSPTHNFYKTMGTSFDDKGGTFILVQVLEMALLTLLLTALG